MAVAGVAITRLVMTWIVVTTRAGEQGSFGDSLPGRGAGFTLVCAADTA